MSARRYLLLVLLVLASSVLGCPEPPNEEYVNLPVDTTAVRIAQTLGPGDVFEVRVYGEKDLSGMHRVSPEGTINFPLVGELSVLGLSPQEAGLRIQDLLQDGYLKQPFVTVVIKEYNSKKIFVLGEVHKPGTFPFEGSMNIIQAVTLAGGFTPMARRNHIIVTRVQDGKEIRVSLPVGRISEGLSPNFLLKPGDIVYVPEKVL